MKSIVINNIMLMIALSVIKFKVGGLLEACRQYSKYPRADWILSALKKTQAMVTAVNVNPIWSSSLGDGSHRPSATASLVFCR